jgi:ribosomal protein S24E
MACSDVLHPNRPNVSKEELRGKLAELYKGKKDDVSVFGFKTHFGGGKSTGFALIYDSAEAMKKFEPHYRLVRYGMASKIEKASRQQRTSASHSSTTRTHLSDEECPGHMLTRTQASSARTGRRSSGVRPRPRVATRRRNKRFRYDGRDGVGSLVWVVHRGRDGVAVGIIIVYSYEKCLKNSCTRPARWDGV